MQDAELKSATRLRIMKMRDRLREIITSDGQMTEQECEEFIKEALACDTIAAIYGFPRMPAELKDHMTSGLFKLTWTRKAEV